MTLVIAAITKKYAMLASDRQLTWTDGPRSGQVAEDDRCKLVSLCNMTGIGYTGVSTLGGMPTHDWIATILARADCTLSWQAVQVLPRAAEQALAKLHPSSRGLGMILAGWDYFENPPQLKPFVGTISNLTRMSVPPSGLTVGVLALPEEKQLIVCSIGQELSSQRVGRLLPDLKQRLGDPQAMVLRLAGEIIHVSRIKKNKYVGEKVLTLCIPRKAVEQTLRTGHTIGVAALPNEHSAAFSYFEPRYNDLRQYGPTFSCSGNAMTDFQGGMDGATQWAQVKILHLRGMP